MAQMKFLFKRAVKIGKRTFSCGFHYVEQEHQETRFFQKLLGLGLIMSSDDAALSAPKLKMDLESLDPRVKAEAQRIMNSTKQRVANTLKVEPKLELGPSAEESSDSKTLEELQKKSSKQKK